MTCGFFFGALPRLHLPIFLFYYSHTRTLLINICCMHSLALLSMNIVTDVDGV